MGPTRITPRVAVGGADAGPLGSATTYTHTGYHIGAPV